MPLQVNKFVKLKQKLDRSGGAIARCKFFTALKAMKTTFYPLSILSPLHRSLWRQFNKAEIPSYEEFDHTEQNAIDEILSLLGRSPATASKLVKQSEFGRQEGFRSLLVLLKEMQLDGLIQVQQQGSLMVWSIASAASGEQVA